MRTAMAAAGGCALLASTMGLAWTLRAEVPRLRDVGRDATQPDGADIALAGANGAGDDAPWLAAADPEVAALASRDDDAPDLRLPGALPRLRLPEDAAPMTPRDRALVLLDRVDRVMADALDVLDSLPLDTSDHPELAARGDAAVAMLVATVTAAGEEMRALEPTLSDAARQEFEQHADARLGPHMRRLGNLHPAALARLRRGFGEVSEVEPAVSEDEPPLTAERSRAAAGTLDDDRPPPLSAADIAAIEAGEAAEAALAETGDDAEGEVLDSDGPAAPQTMTVSCGLRFEPRAARDPEVAAIAEAVIRR